MYQWLLYISNRWVRKTQRRRDIRNHSPLSRNHSNRKVFLIRSGCSCRATRTSTTRSSSCSRDRTKRRRWTSWKTPAMSPVTWTITPTRCPSGRSTRRSSPPSWHRRSIWVFPGPNCNWFGAGKFTISTLAMSSILNTSSLSKKSLAPKKPMMMSMISELGLWLDPKNHTLKSILQKEVFLNFGRTISAIKIKLLKSRNAKREKWNEVDFYVLNQKIHFILILWWLKIKIKILYFSLI